MKNSEDLPAKIVFISGVYHRGQQQIAIRFPIYFEINSQLKKMVCRYSNTHKCWLIPLSASNFQQIEKIFSQRFTIDRTALNAYLQNINAAAKQSATAIPRVAALPAAAPKALCATHTQKTPAIHAANAHVLPAIQQALVLKSYSASTQRTYLNEVAQFLQTIKGTPADGFTVQRTKDYLYYCHSTLKLSENTLHSRMNALKFYYEQVINKEKFFWEIPRPKKPLQLPKLLNETELAKLFNALTNKKHKAMLFTAYSAGLRVSEIVNLTIADIDSQRMQILVQRAKEKKDRYVNLSPVLLDILRGYMREYRPMPVKYLFESEQTGAAYPTRTVQQIFSNAKIKAGIRKEVGIHSLRHSFATHMLEKGIDIKYIKDLLGHFDIKTTERYLHVSRKALVNIVSPLDDLWKKGDIEW